MTNVLKNVNHGSLPAKPQETESKGELVLRWGGGFKGGPVVQGILILGGMDDDAASLLLWNCP